MWAQPSNVLATPAWPGGVVQGPPRHYGLVARPLTSQEVSGLPCRPGHWPTAGYRSTESGVQLGTLP